MKNLRAGLVGVCFCLAAANAQPIPASSQTLTVSLAAMNVPQLADSPEPKVQAQTRVASALPTMSALAEMAGGWKSAEASQAGKQASPNTKLSIAVRELTIVPGDVVLLKDVAAISGADEAARAKAAAINLGLLPRLNSSVRLTAPIIEACLRKEGFNKEETHLWVPPQASVSREAQVLRREDVMREAAKIMQAASGQNPDDLVLRDWNLPTDSQIPAGASQVKIEPRQRGAIVGIQPFDVVVNVDGKEAMRTRGSVFVDVMVPVVRAAAAVDVGETIQRRHISIARAPQSSLPTRALCDADKAVGKICARAIQLGDVLRGDSLKSQILVNRNDVVIMAVNAPRMHLQTKGVAKTAGGEGDIITVINPTSGRETMARVVGPQRVEVIY
ncbi:MAG: flagellar basal body P-ring formation chaperone FlgA [Candidatus Sumerlaeota bacterium]|nr:flagellar basal body P-ring formation chaperone FlgA [Candidatus Sumerlaeota bacterium]